MTVPDWPDDLSPTRLLDIAEAARVTDPRQPDPAPTADGRVVLESLVAPGRQVTLDPYGRNPLAEEVRQLFPGLAAIAATARPAPRMFTDGEEDLPVYTASGADPVRLLLQLPYRVRHHAAAEASLDLVLNNFPTWARDPRAHVDHPGLQNAVQRIRDWIDQAVQAHQSERTTP